jgi:hypothetical protein
LRAVRPLIKRPRRELGLTLIASMKCHGGLIMAADTEEVMSEPPLLRSNREKLRVLSDHMSAWKVVIGGAGEYDYIGMVGDIINEKVSSSPGTATDIRRAIREAVTEVWRDYARYEQRTVDIKMLIGSASSSGGLRLTVVSGAAIRDGSDLEAIGLGDATFRSLADRFIHYGALSTVAAGLVAAKIFTVYAMLQAKQSIPGVGGNTRIIVLREDGTLSHMKSWSVAAIQRFFGEFDYAIRSEIGMTAVANSSGDEPEKFIRRISKTVLLAYKKLAKELEEIEKDDTLI